MRKLFLLKYLISFLFLNTICFIQSSEYLDTLFGANGVVQTNIGVGQFCQAVAIDANGKILMGGNAIISGNSTLVIARYNNDGSLDTTFAGNGYLTTTIGISPQLTNLIVVNDKILICGYTLIDTSGNLFVGRFNNDGTLDTSFNKDGDNPGFFTLTIGEGASSNSIVVQNNLIYITGCATINRQGNFLFACIDNNGTLYPNFGHGGIVTQSLNTSSVSATSIVIDSNNYILSGGFCANGGFVLMRLDPTGNLDSSFNLTGKVVTQNLGMINWTILSGSKIITVGISQLISGQAVIAQYLSNGQLDAQFGNQGIIKIDTYPRSCFNSAILQSDGKIIAVGTANVDNLDNFFIMRFNSDGTPDTTFGNNGTILTLIDNACNCNDCAIQNDGKIIAVGSAYLQSEDNSLFALSRYNKSNTSYIKIFSPEAGSKIETKYPKISGKSSAFNKEVDIYINGIFFQTVNTDSSGNWITSETTPLPKGINVVKANLKVSGIVIASDQSQFTVDTLELTTKDYICACRTIYLDGSIAWQDVSFNSILVNDGWTYNQTTNSFIANDTGRYLISYQATGTSIKSNATKTITIRVLVNSAEVKGGTSAISVDNAKSNNGCLSRSFISEVSAGSNLKLQFQGDGVRLNPAGSGINNQSITLTIIRVG